MLGEDFEYKMNSKRESSSSNRMNNPRPRGREFPNTHRNSAITAESIPRSATQLVPQPLLRQEAPQASNPMNPHWNVLNPNPPPVTHNVPSNPYGQNHNTPNSASQNRPAYVCYNCDTPGHTSRYCRRPRRPFCRNCRKKDVRTEDCNCLQNVASSTFCTFCRRQGQTSESYPCRIPSGSGVLANQQSISTVLHNSPFTDKRPRRDVEILGKSFNALLDSGATTSYINSNVVRWLECNGQFGVDVNVCTYMANRAVDRAVKAYY